jgi:hypothetical protein
MDAVVFVALRMAEKSGEDELPLQVPGANCEPFHTKHCPTTAPAWVN